MCLNSPCVCAPELCTKVRSRTRATRTVAQAIPARNWIKDIKGRLTIAALEQYVHIWHSTDQAQLRPGAEDVIKWRWSPTATYTAKSAYRTFFEGSTRFGLAKPLWKAWAPLKVKFTIWLVVHGRLWTADRRQRHGLQESLACAFCDQDRETCDHLFHTCYFSKQIWFEVSRLLHRPGLAQHSNSLIQWWLQARRGNSKTVQKGIDSTVLLVSWRLWKARNESVFRGQSPTVTGVMNDLMEEASNWVQAGARLLGDLGWPARVHLAGTGTATSP